jgi:hypothetical protein
VRFVEPDKLTKRLALEAFDEEPEPDDSGFLTEDQLRQIVKDVLPRVEQYFIE